MNDAKTTITLLACCCIVLTIALSKSTSADFKQNCGFPRLTRTAKTANG